TQWGSMLLWRWQVLANNNAPSEAWARERMRAPVVRVLHPIRGGQEESYRDLPPLSLSELDVPVDGLELEPGAAGLADMRPEMLGIEPAAHRHFEVREQGSIHRLEIHVAAEVAGEVHDDAPVHRLEFHVRVGIDAAHSRPDVAVDVGRVDRSAGRADVHFAVHGAGVHFGRCAGDAHRAVHRLDRDFDAARNANLKFHTHVVVPRRAVAVRLVVSLVASRPLAPERAHEDVLAAGSELLGVESHDSRIAFPPTLGPHDLDLLAARLIPGEAAVHVLDPDPTADGNAAGPFETLGGLSRLSGSGQREASEKE